MSDTRLSLLLLTFVIAVACGGLALDGNWAKLLRVSASYAAYAATLGAAMAYRRAFTPLLRDFLVAGAVAGFVSGIVRPELDPLVVIVSIGGGALVGAMHRLAVTRWRTVARAITGS